MAVALVGAAGAATQGAVGVAVTPAWDAGASRTAGNMLLCFVSSTGAATLPGAITGWTRQAVSGTSSYAVLYYAVAAGADAAPTVPAVASSVLSVHLEEWSGVEQAFPQVLNNGGASGTTSPITATIGQADLVVGQLVTMVGADFRSAARASNDTWTSNNGTPILRASNNGVSSVNHYSHATLVSNSTASADTAIMSISLTTSIVGAVVLAVSFKLAAPPSATPPYINPYVQVLPQ